VVVGNGRENNFEHSRQKRRKTPNQEQQEAAPSEGRIIPTLSLGCSSEGPIPADLHQAAKYRTAQVGDRREQAFLLSFRKANQRGKSRTGASCGRLPQNLLEFLPSTNCMPVVRGKIPRLAPFVREVLPLGVAVYPESSCKREKRILNRENPLHSFQRRKKTHVRVSREVPAEEPRPSHPKTVKKASFHNLLE